VIFLHGGPGSGCQEAHRALFDAKHFRAILFDQRGAGRSTPKRELAHNTTQHLIADMERIRAWLGIERWMVVGGSWGALLAVAYAQRHPERVTGLVLRALLLGARAEIAWAFRDGPRTFYPELWRAFLEPLPKDERDDPIAAYGARLMDPRPEVQVAAARLWHDFERALSVLRPGELNLPRSLEEAARSTTRVPDSPFFEWHYLRNDFFLEPDALLGEASRLSGIPGVIVQGRYDLLCPPATAHSLAARWPEGELQIVEGAGHSHFEAPIQKAVKAAIDRLGGLV